MKFIITLIKVAIVSFLATSIFYLFEYIEYGGVQDFFSFIKKFYLYVLFIVILGILAKRENRSLSFEWIFHEYTCSLILGF